MTQELMLVNHLVLSLKSQLIRVILSIAVSLNWPLKHIDINNAFLNRNLQEKVFMRQPEGFESTTYPYHVWRLNKALYGLKQAQGLGITS